MMSRTFSHATLVCVLLALGLDASHATDQVPARADFGMAQVAAIQARYDATPDDCGGTEKPAFLCSGVLVRVTGNGIGYHVWNPSASSVGTGGVSFSYLRADTNFSGLVFDYTDGVIFAASHETSIASVIPDLMCSFPLDANSWQRPAKGCGLIRGNVAVTAPCQSQNVFTATEWYTHFMTLAGDYHENQCGFTTTGIANTAPAFLASLQARQLLSSDRFSWWNEVMLATWPQNIGASLPIEAFFYVVMPNGLSGLLGAQRNQRDLLATVGVAVPVVRITLPSAPGGKTSFAYNPAEQVIPLPTLPGSLDLPPSVVQAPAGTLRVQDILARQDIQVSVPAQPGVQAGDVGRVRWLGARTFYETPAQPVAADQPTLFAIPRGSVLATLGQAVDVSYVVTDKTLAIERASPVLSLTVDAADGTLPPPELAADRSYAKIGYSGMLSTDQIRVSYEGNGTHDTAFPKKTAAFNAGIPPSWLGAPDQLYYWVKRGTQMLVSPVVTPTRGPWPIVPEAANGWLDFAALSADPVVTVAPWDGIAAGQSVWLDALAYFPDGSEQATTLIDAKTIDDSILRDGLRATVPRDRLRRLPDGSAVFLRTRVAAPGGNFAGARAFPVTRLTLRNAPGPIVTRPLPRIVDARTDGSVIPVEGVLSRSALKGALQARVAPWPGMAVGQRVWLRLRGRKPDGSEWVVDLAPNYAVVVADLTNGLIRPIPLDRLDALAEQSSTILELKVGFEKLADETRALRFPINHMAYGK
jgi:hypothetical protein